MNIRDYIDATTETMPKNLTLLEVPTKTDSSPRKNRKKKGKPTNNDLKEAKEKLRRKGSGTFITTTQPENPIP